MPIAFSNIPPNTLLPLFYAEVTSAQEPISPNLKICLVGSMNKGEGFDEGDAVENYPYILAPGLASQHFGRGSMLYRMYQFARSNAPFAEIWGVAIPEADGAFRRTVTVTVTRGGSETFYGHGEFWIDGMRVQFPITKTATANSIAIEIKNRIRDGSYPYKPISISGPTVTLACRWMGAYAQYILCSFIGCFGRSDLARKGVHLARNCVKFANVTDGSGENLAAGCIAVLADRPFDVFVIPASHNVETYQMKAWKDFMDHDGGRWAPNRQMYGHVFGAFRNASFQQTWEMLDPHEDPHHSILCVKNSVLSPWCWGSALGAVATVHWAAPPELSRPLQTLQLRNCCCGTDDDESFSRLEKQSLLEVGATTITVQSDHECTIDRVRTLRKRNDFEDPDPSWADAITMFQAQYFVKQMRMRIQGAYPRCALSNMPVGINGFTSPIEIRALIIHQYKNMQTAGLVENADLFARYLIVERNATDRNRVDVLMRPDFINQLRVVAALVETHLELDATDPTLIAG